MDAEENNLNQGVDKVTEVLDLVNSLIGDIGRDDLSEVEANVKLVNTCERLLELNHDLEEIQCLLQDMQETQLCHQHPPQPQQPQDSTDIFIHFFGNNHTSLFLHKCV